MHRIDGPGATKEKRFTSGDPVIPIPPTTVTAEWLNMVQDELEAIIAEAGITPDKKTNDQVLKALQKIVNNSKPDLATTTASGLAPRLATNTEVEKRTGAGLVAANQLPAPVISHLLCEFYFFRSPTLRPGFLPAQGGLLENAATLYPEAWAYLQTTEGQMLCKAEAEWQAMTKAVWHTCADGTQIGWNGIGGAPFYAPNYATGALRLPDLRGMYAEAAGFDSLGVGGVHGDGIRNITGAVWHVTFGGDASSGVIETQSSGGANIRQGGYWGNVCTISINAARSAPISAKNQPRAFGALACVYLGAPK